MSELFQSRASTPNAEWLAELMRPATPLQAITPGASAEVVAHNIVQGTRGSPRRAVQRYVGPTDLAHKLASRGLDLKAHVSLVAMHLDASWRDGLFRQLDFMLSPDNWEDVDDLPSKESFATAVRLIIYLGNIRRPGLGLTPVGNLILSWTSGGDRLTVECQPDDVIKWIITHVIDGMRESAAGISSAKRLPIVLQAYEPSKWLKHP